jgi:hypothetical protein
MDRTECVWFKNSITVLIFNGVYTNEIKEQLNSYNKNIKYVSLE